MRLRLVNVGDEKFWDTDTPFIDHEEIAPPSRGARQTANFIFFPIFILTAVVIPIFLVMGSDTKAIVGWCLFSPLYALFPYGLYSIYVSLISEHTLRINSGSGSITLSVKKPKGQEIIASEHPIKEIKRIEARETDSEEGGSSISVTIKGKNPLGVPWTIDITPFSYQLYDQGKPSTDRKRITTIKTAERYAELLGVEVVSWVKIRGTFARDLRKEFGVEWINQWAFTPGLEERNRRIMNEEKEERQKIQEDTEGKSTTTTPKD